ncbi:MAG: C40 family peptidase [Anaerolineales bacterium]|nr:C40 family peptidase [Anaerolineales bacterium]
MIDEIQAALTDFSQRDSRIHYCQLDVDALERNQCVLSGTVLDEESLAEAKADLATRFPNIAFDTHKVKILSHTPPRVLTVGTNMTSVHSEPSWRAEQMTQALHGWQVEILLEQESWAFVRQSSGYLGWMYRPYLTGVVPPPATHVVYEPVALLRAEPQAEAALVGRMLAGTAVAVTAVEGRWAQLSLANDKCGWLPQACLRALDALPESEDGRRQTIVETAHTFMGVPYLWGGSTALGIDCSGFAQLTHRLAGVEIPRDADMQFNAGKPVEPPFQPGDLFFFGSERGHRAISHVGISLGGWRTIHSSRSRNGVYIDDVQEAPYLRDIYIGARTFLQP